MQLSSPIW